jgi:transposase-like protein
MSKKAKIRTSRRFSESFKKAVVDEYTSGNFSVGQLCKMHQLHSQNVYTWIYKYSNIAKPEKVIVELKKSATQKLADYENRISELEKLLGRKQIEIEYLKKIIEVASDEHGIDLKKNINTKL